MKHNIKYNVLNAKFGFHAFPQNSPKIEHTNNHHVLVPFDLTQWDASSNLKGETIAGSLRTGSLFHGTFLI